MPLGDPGGGAFEYTVEGLPETLFMVTVPCRRLADSVRFYEGVLMFEKVFEGKGSAILRRADLRMLLKECSTFGVDTGIYLGVSDPYDFHRRFIDEGLSIVREPERTAIGVSCSFKDPDGNIINIVEMKARILDDLEV